MIEIAKLIKELQKYEPNRMVVVGNETEDERSHLVVIGTLVEGPAYIKI
jgi:hypothetical protein